MDSLPSWCSAFEVEVDEPLVVVPSVAPLPRGEADRLCGLKVEDIEATRPVVHLDEKTSVMIPNVKHALVNLHLPQVHDGVT
jgi:hypothetical protein